ncbi:hypothetical protein ABIE66_001268 [Peribacillus sp. B2I2]
MSSIDAILRIRIVHYNCILAFIHIKCIIESAIKQKYGFSVSFFLIMEEMKDSRKIKPFTIFHYEQMILGKDTYKGIQC